MNEARYEDYARLVLESPTAFFKAFTGRDPYPYQADFLHDSAPLVAWVAGRQIGKTECAAIKALHHAYSGPDRTVLLLAPTQEKAGLVFWRARQVIKHDAFLQGKVIQESAATLRLANGSSIIARPAGTSEKSPTAQQAARGYAASLVIVDEAAQVPDSAFASFEPTLASTQGQLVLVSTPYGARGRFYQACKGTDSHFFSRHEVASPECPHITKEFLEQQAAKFTEVEYRQEYLCEFIADVDLFFPHDLYLHCLSRPAPTEDEKAECDFYLGVDLARMGSDSSVYTVAAVQPATLKAFIVHIEATRKQPLTDAMGRIKALHEKFNFRRIYTDETGLGAGVGDVVKEWGLPITPVTFTIEAKEELYKNLKLCAEQGRLRLPEHDRLRNELTQLQYEYTMQHLKVHHPDLANAHDDHADSLALAVWALRHPASGFPLAGAKATKG